MLEANRVNVVVVSKRDGDREEWRKWLDGFDWISSCGEDRLFVRRGIANELKRLPKGSGIIDAFTN